MKPEKVFRVGSVSASVFVIEAGDDDSRREFRSVKLQRSYRDGESWKSSSTFGLAELSQVGAVLQMAQTYVAEKEADVTPQ